jgi:hypothetical protein
VRRCNAAFVSIFVFVFVTQRNAKHKKQQNTKNNKTQKTTKHKKQQNTKNNKTQKTTKHKKQKRRYIAALHINPRR